MSRTRSRSGRGVVMWSSVVPVVGLMVSAGPARGHALGEVEGCGGVVEASALGVAADVGEVVGAVGAGALGPLADGFEADGLAAGDEPRVQLGERHGLGLVGGGVGVDPPLQGAPLAAGAADERLA